MAQTHTSYTPGVCNIGDAEIRNRRRFGYANLAVTVLLYAIIVWGGVDRVWRLIIFFPAFGAALGFLQAKMHFCAYFGLSSLYNFGEVGDSPEEIWEEELRAIDRKKAWTIIVYALLLAMATAIVGYALPFSSPGWTG